MTIDRETTEKRPKGNDWTCVPNTIPMDVTSFSTWQSGPVRVISVLETAELPRGGIGPQWHVTISRNGKRPKDTDVRRVLRAFGLVGAERDNHQPTIADHYWMPLDPAQRVDCQCKTTEDVITEKDGFTWTNPKAGDEEACRGCEYEKTFGRPCTLHATRAHLARMRDRGLPQPMVDYLVGERTWLEAWENCPNLFTRFWLLGLTDPAALRLVTCLMARSVSLHVPSPVRDAMELLVGQVEQHAWHTTVPFRDASLLRRGSAMGHVMAQGSLPPADRARMVVMAAYSAMLLAVTPEERCGRPAAASALRSLQVARHVAYVAALQDPTRPPHRQAVLGVSPVQQLDGVYDYEPLHELVLAAIPPEHFRAMVVRAFPS